MPTLPLFPLHTVLFPDGPLKLRIFEARYVDMIGRCMREAGEFGVILILEGREAGGPVRTTEIGTAARIVDFEKLPDGLLGITALGTRRFNVAASHRQPDGLNVADIAWIPPEGGVAVPEELSILAEVLRQAFPQIAAMYGEAPARFDDATWVGMRLAELLPLSLHERQQCLEMNDPIERLRMLRERLDVRSA